MMEVAMAQNITAAEYFEQVLPERFATAAAEFSDEVRQQDEFTVTYDLAGEGGGVYGLRIRNGALEVVPGGLPESDMRTTAAADDWRATALELWEEPVLDYYRRGKVRVIKGLKGVLKLELARDGAPDYESTTIFGGADEPEVTLRMTVADYAAMVKGELNGNMAFMTGKLKFDGSLPLLMQLGALNA
jgi:putative sterol carrier protein